MQNEEQNFEAEIWQGEYLETWPRLPLGLRRHLARIAPQEAFQLILSDGNDEVFEAFWGPKSPAPGPNGPYRAQN